MAAYYYTLSAERDLEAIPDYTLETWGAIQAGRYLDGIESLAKHLAANPGLGVKREELRQGLLVFPYERHRIYYMVTPRGLAILRVLHERMEPRIHVKEENG